MHRHDDGRQRSPQNCSNSCSFDLPVLPGDAPTWIRSAAYAEFADLATGKPFLVVSAHLDYRHSDNKRTEGKLNDLRRLQAATIWANMNLIRKVGEPVIVAGDFNASQADKGGNGPHDYLVEQGFYDAAGAVQQVNLEFPSLNHFDKVLTADPQGYARRVDQILVYGAAGSKKFKQVVEARTRPATPTTTWSSPTSSCRPSEVRSLLVARDSAPWRCRSHPFVAAGAPQCVRTCSSPTGTVVEACW